MIDKPAELDTLLEIVLTDYYDERRFFEAYQLPEYEVLNELDLQRRERALFLTLTCVTNHIHDEFNESKQTAGPNGLWQVSGNLWQHHQWLFEPAELVGNDRKDELVRIFESTEIMDQRDPDWWYRNSKTLYETWDSDPHNLLANPTVDTDGKSASFDAIAIKEAVHSHDFPALGGDKILPLWLRLMHEEIRPMDRIDQISIPVDFHIVGITNRLRGGEQVFDQMDAEDKETLRTFWQLVCERNDFIPVILDKPLWLLHKYWADGGQEYIENRLAAIRKK